MRFAVDWQQSLHPRGQGGQFAPKAGGSHAQRAVSAVEAWKSGMPSTSHDIGNTATTTSVGKGKDYSSETAYRSQQSAQKRISWLTENGFTQQQAQQYESALTGTKESPGWFYRGNFGIRTLKTESDQQKAAKMHEFILASPKYEGQVTRGIGMWQQDFDKLKPGATFKETGAFSSWSADEGVAKDFALNFSRGQYHVVLHLTNPSYGAPVAPLSMLGSEQQVLVSNLEQSEYTIRNVEKDRFYHHVYLQEMKR